LYVGGSGPGNYTSIQDAIDNASDGDFIFIYNDIYEPLSNIHVYKELTLIGESKEGVIIEHETGSEELSIRAKNATVSSITFRNFRVTNEDIFDGTVITNNIFIIDNDEKHWNPEVIYMAGENNEISDNTMIFTGTYTGDNNPHTGIFFQCYQSRIINNTIIGIGSGSGYYEAILLLDRSYWVDDLVKGKNIIEGNTFSKTGCGIYLNPTLRPGYNSRIIHNNFIDNTINAQFAIHLPSVVDIIRNNIKRLKYFVNSPDNQNTFFSGLPLNYWDENYWSDYIGPGPKTILGSLQSEGFVNQFFFYVLPWVNVDWHPAQEPYDIPG
jgi:flavin-binding protein dodecin